MRPFGLCSIGHAITDLLFPVQESDLLELRIKKGSRCLAEPAFWDRILQKFQLIKPVLGAGGSAGNSLAAFSRLGGKSIFISKTGDDDLSKYYMEQMQDAGVECRFSIAHGQPSGRCLVLVTPDGGRTMLTDLGVGRVLGSECIDKQALAESTWFLAEGYLLSDNFQTVREALSIAKTNGLRLALSLSDAVLVTKYRQRFLALLPEMDLVLGNEEEACALCAETNLKRALDKLSTKKALIVVTVGDKGAWLIESGERFLIPAFPCRPLDTTGAGDVFAGAFIYGIHIGYPAQRAAIGAAFIAMKSITKMGARFAGSLVPDWEQAMKEP